MINVKAVEGVLVPNCYLVIVRILKLITMILTNTGCNNYVRQML